MMSKKFIYIKRYVFIRITESADNLGKCIFYKQLAHICLGAVVFTIATTVL